MPYLAAPLGALRFFLSKLPIPKNAYVCVFAWGRRQGFQGLLTSGKRARFPMLAIDVHKEKSSIFMKDFTRIKPVNLRGNL